MKAGAFRSRGVMAAVTASVASSVLGFIAMVISGQLNLAGMGDPLMGAPVIAAIVLLWVPAFAFIPAAVLGWLVERPKARKMIALRTGGLVLHLAVSITAALLLWLLFRILLFVASATPRFMDEPSLVLVALVGLCSGISWWLLVVEPGRRE